MPQIKDYGDRQAIRSGGNGWRTIDAKPPVVSEPLVTIVTIVFNNDAGLERAIDSVLRQTYRNIEYIVIDGGSTDGSVAVIQAHEERIAYWHSAADGGISDAFNWGVSLARGAFVGLVNSDDWMGPEQVAQAVAAMEGGAPFVFGDLVYHNPDGTPAYTIRGDGEYWRHLWHRMPQVTHPTALVRKSIYEGHGLFDTSLRIGMDYDWLFRLHRAGLHGLYTPRVRGHMSLGGVSDIAWRRCLDEHLSIAIKYGGKPLLLKSLFWGRRWKIRIRQTVERWLPKPAAVMIRRLLNRSLR